MRILGKGRRTDNLPPERNTGLPVRDLGLPPLPPPRLSVPAPEPEPRPEQRPEKPQSIPTRSVEEPSNTETTMALGQREHGEVVDTCIGKDSHISGTLKFSGTVRIDGHVEGEISAQETIVVGDTAVVEAQVTADSIIITGKVTGDVTARRRLEIRAPGQLQGNITTPSLVIHDGVRFEGQCSMGRAIEANRSDTKAKPAPTGPNGSVGAQT